MTLVNITEASHDVLVDLKLATPNNFTNQIIYEFSDCWLHPDALVCLEKSIILAQQQSLKLKILDAYRPQAAQEKLWKYRPNPKYVAPPERGSHHTRGVAIDLTLVDKLGHELDMGMPSDGYGSVCHHGATNLSQEAAANRYMLLGIMMSAGWDLYHNEWWHYQLFKAAEYPLIVDLKEAKVA